MQIYCFTNNPFQENTYILYDETKEAIIVDCGVFIKSEQDLLTEFIEMHELKIVKLIHTHLHIDHIFGYKWSNEKYGLLTYAHKADEFLLTNFQAVCDEYGVDVSDKIPPKIGTYVTEGDIISFGNTKLEVLHVPGHSPGHLCFFEPKSQNLIAGDTLFHGSIGRTDFPYANSKQLITNIKDKLFDLEDGVAVHPGHGISTTIGWERKNNPFLQ